MSTLRASEVGRRLTSIDALPPVIVVFGPDRGLVTEVAANIAKLFDASSDPFAVVRLDAATVTGEAGRLSDEARTVSMFGDKRLVWVRDAGGKNLAPSVAPLLADPPTDAVVLIEAGDLKKGIGLRKDAEAAQAAVAIYCPPDSVRDLERMVDEEAASLGLTVDAEARAALIERLGADRGASRSEVAKVCLHAASGDRLTLADVDAVVGDVSVTEMAEVVDAALLGQRDRLAALLPRVLKQDSHAVTLLMNAQWALQGFELAAAAVAAGTAPGRAVEGMRPPLYGPRKAAGARILDRWTPARLRVISAAVADAIFTTRTRPALSIPVTQDLMLRIVCQDGR